MAARSAYLRRNAHARNPPVPLPVDNYGFLLHDPDSGETACIDTPDADAYLREAAAERGWQITQIWNTHWHPDHAGGNAAIKAATGCTITGPGRSRPRSRRSTGR